jgi:hypothetical protein
VAAEISKNEQTNRSFAEGFHMKILKFKPFERNTLRGFLEVETPQGMIIKGLTWHRKTDGEKVSEWIGLPAREYTKDDGSKGWANIVDFATKNLYWDFTYAILKALKEHLDQEKASLPVEVEEQETARVPF